MTGRLASRRARLLAGVGAVVAVIVVLLMTGLGKDPSVIASPLVDRVAPNFTLPQLDGPPVTLAKLRGQIVVINFWASWCTECQVEQAALDQTWQQFRDSGVVVLGVDFEDSTGAARGYVRTDERDVPGRRGCQFGNGTRVWPARGSGDVRRELLRPDRPAT